MAPPSTIYARSPGSGSLRQGEILSTVVQAHLAMESIRHAGETTVEIIEHPFALIMTQGCDLAQDCSFSDADARSDRQLPNILFCAARDAAELRRSAGMNSPIWQRIRTNQHDRYHFLERIVPEDDLRGEGLPELALDFKRYFTVPTDEVYARVETETVRRCHLNSPYLEHLTTRFYNFMGRVALPAPHVSEPADPP